MNEAVLLDIPRFYTAMAEWAACSLYICILKKRSHKLPLVFIMAAALFLQCAVQISAGFLPIALWIPAMAVAIGMMLLYIYIGCDISWKNAGYYTVLAFILAEFVASLEWQLYYYMVAALKLRGIWLELLFLVVVYGIVFLCIWLLERKLREGTQHFSVTAKELCSVAAIGVAVFLVSNLSFVYSDTPFSSQMTKDIFNTRTLIDLSGLSILYAYHVLKIEMKVKYELDAIQNILKNQYLQYRQSKESIDMVNRKYHDLKHQIALLRVEQDSAKRLEFIDAMENEIKSYDVQNKTGNPVVDTVLTGKSMNCQKFQIELTSVVDGTLLNFMHVVDICTILGNALDNAIECEVQIVNKDKRLIHVAIFGKSHFVVMRFENYFEGKLDFTDKLPKTTKSKTEYHGFGLKSIQYTAEKYGGYVTINQENNWFALNVMIPLPK